MDASPFTYPALPPPLYFAQHHARCSTPCSAWLGLHSRPSTSARTHVRTRASEPSTTSASTLFPRGSLHHVAALAGAVATDIGDKLQGCSLILFSSPSDPSQG
ncbi:hypothetical protein GUJ93_ZPchr0011g28155 [Zizania palustris]|uniref:Uncharacterized protein n=1 Tax=Zizania palustris TaxID=103762 RepID=A0A8J5WGZ9_ZIZPA|nr:hypothetical protein GUJ93_ZPchr0011g28155 [Zizania palustris]